MVAVLFVSGRSQHILFLQYFLMDPQQSADFVQPINYLYCSYVQFYKIVTENVVGRLPEQLSVEYFALEYSTFLQHEKNKISWYRMYPLK